MPAGDKRQASENELVEVGRAVDPARSSPHTAEDSIVSFLRVWGTEDAVNGWGKEDDVHEYLERGRKSLVLDNVLGVDGAKVLAAALRDNTTITTLNLNKNEIGDEGAAAIVKGLRGNTTLTCLVLMANEIGDKGAAAIGEALHHNTTITHLLLDLNKIGDEGAAAIGEGLRCNTTLIHLHLSNNSISCLPEEMGDALTNLEYFYLRNNELTRLPRSIGKMNKDCELCFDGNPLKEPPLAVANQGAEAIARYFEEYGNKL
eukprot:CAMPEP_0194274722 /NCGR_PEP_ID=MMETSP0169-20130528/7733_1 /TAXON_ID=218684 /ORGANISM="Corethron pennatum, Strain L29A3" /LENGTH=259 /DNA_ID=CAMNT_0039017993 /DNA_START=82 /DNA_END=861 /DNA_ORIENTATION=+